MELEIIVSTKTLILGIVFFVINLSALSVMVIDKIKSQKNSRRISEGMIFFMATAFGSFGVYAGMFAVRHKTRKWYFLIGIPLLMIQNCTFLYIVYTILV